ncbi:MAG: acyl-CoA dehydrogenase family protein [Actinomycetota bacterium]|nr:acyl-CoA dehydrogenase family protein [Actinomycetota bacterium]
MASKTRVDTGEFGAGGKVDVPLLQALEEVRAIARSGLAPLTAAADAGRVNRPLLEAMGEAGLLGRLFPSLGSEDSPSDVSATELCLLREAIASVDTHAETALALQGLGGYPILQAGTDEIRKRWMPAIAAGKAVAAFALSEPGAGSDAAAIEARAVRDGEGWRLYGEKSWISNAPEADVYSIFVKTAPEAGSRGVSAFALPGDRPGVSGEHIDLLAPHPIGRLVLDGVHVGPEDLLGEENKGFRVAMRTLNLFRPSVGAFAVGMARSALDAAVMHGESRVAFGAALAEQQSVSHLLAEMATRLEAARLLVYAAASAYDQRDEQEKQARLSAMAKYFATETAQFVIDGALQIHGARGLVNGGLLEHLYREVRATRIYEGATEVQRTIVARSLRKGVRPADGARD